MITRTITSERTLIVLGLCMASTAGGPVTGAAPHNADGA
jgi:hypothetical protein